MGNFRKLETGQAYAIVGMRFSQHHEGATSESPTCNLVMDPRHHKTIFGFSNGIICLRHIIIWDEKLKRCCLPAESDKTLILISFLAEQQLCRHDEVVEFDFDHISQKPQGNSQGINTQACSHKQ